MIMPTKKASYSDGPSTQRRTKKKSSMKKKTSKKAGY